VTYINPGKDPFQALGSFLDKLTGIGGTHSKQPHIKKRSDERAAGSTLLLCFAQHAVEKIVTCQDGVRIALTKGYNHRSCATADVQNALRELLIARRRIHQKVPGIVFVPPGMKPDESIIAMGKEVIVFPSSCSQTRHLD
jgi:DNA-directed RNA polymerase beta' subunit